MSSLSVAVRPRVLSLPADSVGSWGVDAAQLSARNGMLLDPWQADGVLHGAMSYRFGGGWAADKVALIVARQNGKNAVLEARELYGLVVLGEWIIHTSHLFTTTKESYNRLLALIEANPETSELLTYQVASPASGYEMRFKSGGRIRFIARSRTSGRGLTGDLLVFDEAQDLNDDALGALLPTISARAGSQTWYQGSAPGPESVVWHRIRRQGRAGEDDRMAYFEYSAEPDASLDDPAAWAQANPAPRVTVEAIQAERGSMSDEMFARERLSISPDPVNDADRVFPAAVWDAVCSPDVNPDGRIMFALDVNPERSAGAVAVADSQGRCELIAQHSGVGWIVDRVEQLVGRWGSTVAVDPYGPAGPFISELEQRNVSVLKVSGNEFAQACGAFYDAVHGGTVKIRRHPALDSAAAGAQKRASGDSWKWARRDASVDVSPLVAVTLAFRAAATAQSVTPGFVDLSDYWDEE
jgi:hypothetical protein